MADPGPRRSGLLTGWNDERGFGFIVPADGSRRVFVHISEFPSGAPRPGDGDELSFVIGSADGGRSQATGIEVLNSVRLARTGPVAKAPVDRHRAPISWVPIYVVPVFAILFALMCVYWPVPLWVMILYPAMSVVTYAIYVLDKRAAMSNGWRIRETTMQLAALLGGWPGAVLAQQLLRHKNRKWQFQAVFWCLVVLNIAVLVVIVWYSGPVADLVQLISSWLAGNG